MIGIDYAVTHSRLQLEAAKSGGVRFVMRYLTAPHLSWKRLTEREASMIRDLGLGLGSVYQVRGTEPEDFTLDTADRDAFLAVQNAREVGQDGGVIFFAADFNVPAVVQPTITAYLKRVSEHLSRDGYTARVYGSYATVEARGGASGHWQTYAWSGGAVSQKAALLQCMNGANLAGGENDINIAWSDDFLWVKPQSQTLPLMPTLKHGATKWQVSVLQALLTRSGYVTGGITGTFWDGTQAAVRAFQQGHNLAVDGVAGPQTWAALQADILPAGAGIDWEDRAHHAEETLRRIDALCRPFSDR